MLFMNKNSNKTIAYKKEYFIQKIEITPKRLQIRVRIHNVNKSGLKI
jgi:predicted transport protein